jgi:hypothetical protein
MSVRLRMMPIALLAAAAGLDAPAALATVATGDGTSVVRPAPGVVDATAHKQLATSPYAVDPASARHGRAGAPTAKAPLSASDAPPALGVTAAAPTLRGDDGGVVIGAGLRRIGMRASAESAGEAARALPPEHSPTSASGPTTVALLGIGLAVLGLRQRRAQARRAGTGPRLRVMRVRLLRPGRICAADRAGAAS